MKTQEKLKTRLLYKDCHIIQELWGEDGFIGVMCLAKGDDDVCLKIVAGNGEGWEHVSVSLQTRCPTWREMCHVKNIFWNDDETVIQYHPAKQDYINNHPYCLHLWKPMGVDLPKPPKILIGV